MNNKNESYQLKEVLGGINDINTTLGYKRIYTINKDEKGYYLLVPDMNNIFSQNKEKQYFINEKDIKNIELIEEYNKEVNKYNKDIEEAKDHNRIAEVNQKVSNDILNVTALFYYYENGKEIKMPNKPEMIK